MVEGKLPDALLDPMYDPFAPGAPTALEAGGIDGA